MPSASSACKVFAAALLVSASAFAQPYPSKPVRLVIPFPPGGPADIIGRTVGAKLGDALGQPFVIDSRGGGNGTSTIDRFQR